MAHTKLAFIKEECFDCLKKDNALDDIRYWLKFLTEELQKDCICNHFVKEFIQNIFNATGKKITVGDFNLQKKKTMPDACQALSNTSREALIRLNNECLKQTLLKGITI